MVRGRAFVGIVFVGIFGLAWVAAEAQQPPNRVRGKLPAYYNKLGLSDDQKQQIYTVRAEYDVKIQELQRQIAKLRRDEGTAMRKVLTAAQKARLQEIIKEKVDPGDANSKPTKPERTKSGG